MKVDYMNPRPLSSLQTGLVDDLLNTDKLIMILFCCQIQPLGWDKLHRLAKLCWQLSGQEYEWPAGMMQLVWRSCY